MLGICHQSMLHVTYCEQQISHIQTEDEIKITSDPYYLQLWYTLTYFQRDFLSLGLIDVTSQK